MVHVRFIVGVICASVLLKVTLISAEELRCYECFYACDDPFNNTGVLKKSCGQGSCIKQKTDSGNVVRFCSLSKYLEGCEKTEHREDCACDSDMCNHGNWVVPPFRFVYVLIALTTVFKML